MLFEQSCYFQTRGAEKPNQTGLSTEWEDGWYNIKVRSNKAAFFALEAFRKNRAFERCPPAARCQPYWEDNASRLVADLGPWYPGKSGLLFNLYRSPVTVPPFQRRLVQVEMAKTACEDMFFLWESDFVDNMLKKNLKFCRLAYLLQVFATLIEGKDFEGPRQGEEVIKVFEGHWRRIEALWRSTVEKNPKSMFYKHGGR